MLLHAPGESLRRSVEALLEHVMDRLIYGTLATMMVFLIPFGIGSAFPKPEWLTLGLCSLVLAVVFFVFVVKRVVSLLDERANKKLGYLGERHVAEELQKVAALGYVIFHDIPIEVNGYIQNIDHAAVEPMGLVVIETKTWSKPNEESGTKAKVTFDGERLIWPRYADDYSTIKQVDRCAKWLGKRVKDECEIEPPVQQIVAIPGWEVLPGKFYNPRVVSGRRVAETLKHLHEEKPAALNRRQIEKITQMLDGLCRDVRE